MPMDDSPEVATRGRPAVTSHAEIERAAFSLFAERGFAGTTLDDIAQVVGVGRRTVSRYYASKNDIPWGQFEGTLDHLRELLAQQPTDAPVHLVVHRAVVDFNRFPPDAHPPHQERMRLILTTPELQAHSVLRYAEWRQVIAEHVALRTGGRPDDLVPQVAGHVSLGLSLAAYDAWLASPDPDAAGLLTMIDQAMRALHSYLQL